ncbi:hypothetical protein NDU88_003438 [Pleurodeles waltl]|uniref:Uncharacterized protein n=1 Tax=Pleurodeles waltl TaxID=8319 RepID=A0AAV7MB20_PLEWA|nr:hypothetical protein NDU88_003438 [Pleurodeles waltl]
MPRGGCWLGHFSCFLEVKFLCLVTSQPAGLQGEAKRKQETGACLTSSLGLGEVWACEGGMFFSPADAALLWMVHRVYLADGASWVSKAWQIVVFSMSCCLFIVVLWAVLQNAMGKHACKRKHLVVSSLSSSSSSPPCSRSPSRLDRHEGEEEAHIKLLIRDTLLELGAEGKCSVVPAALPLFSSEEEGLGPGDLMVKCIAKDQLPVLVCHAKGNMSFQEDEAPESSSSALLRQFRSSTPVDVLIYSCICEVLIREWCDPDKIVMPHFMAKLYPLHNMQSDFPDAIPVDSFVASLVGCTSLAEEAILRNPIEKKVDRALKKVFSQ